MRSNVSTGRGMYKSTDGGKTWTVHRALQRRPDRRACAFIRPIPNIVWVAAQGDAFKANAERGIFKTTDGGATWQKVLFVSDTVGAMDVELQPGNPNVVYAWMSRLERKPWTIISGAQGRRLLQEHGRRRALHEDHDRPADRTDRQGAISAVTAAKPDRIYALDRSASRAAASIDRTTRGRRGRSRLQPAQTRRRCCSGRSTTRRSAPIRPTPTSSTRGAESFYKSTDGGKTFATFRTPHGDNHDIWINPKDGNIMIQSNDGGANVSTDGGRTWSSQMQPADRRDLRRLDGQPVSRTSSTGAAGQRARVIISSQAEPMNLADWRGGPGCETGPIMPHPNESEHRLRIVQGPVRA